jgi:hypothetical protein
MVPEIKSHLLISGESLESYKPEDPRNFSLVLRLMVGPRGQPGEESFDITICTPASLAEQCAASGFVLGRHQLIVAAYVPSMIMDVVTRLVARCSGLSWTEVSSKIARIALGEFEDYKAVPGG